MRRRAVRLVNVMGSPGSVGPLFAEQIAYGGPVTVTHPDARRYFISLGEVVSLLAQAMSSEAASGVLVPEPGEPLRITELAERIIAASGRAAEITYTGERPGDKLKERLVGPAERLEGLATAGLRRVVSPVGKGLELYLRALEAGVAARDLDETLRVIRELVPDYEPSRELQQARTEPTAAR